jgi:hypothetical protein
MLFSLRYSTWALVSLERMGQGSAHIVASGRQVFLLPLPEFLSAVHGP